MQKVEKRIDHAITPSGQLSRHFPSNRQWDLRFREKKLPRPERRSTTGNVRRLRHASMTRNLTEMTLSLMSALMLGHRLDWSSFPPESPIGCARSHCLRRTPRVIDMVALGIELFQWISPTSPHFDSSAQMTCRSTRKIAFREPNPLRTIFAFSTRHHNLLDIAQYDNLYSLESNRSCRENVMNHPGG